LGVTAEPLSSSSSLRYVTWAMLRAIPGNYGTFVQVVVVATVEVRVGADRRELGHTPAICSALAYGVEASRWR